MPARRMEVYVPLSLITSNTSLSHERLGAVCSSAYLSSYTGIDLDGSYVHSMTM